MTRSRQLILPLPQAISFARDDYFVSESNRAALALVERWPNWPGGMLAVIGPAGAGKTHLSAVHRARVASSGTAIAIWPDLEAPHLVVEDVDRLVGDTDADEALFHGFNRIAAQGGSILFTARTPVAGWPVALPDLRTRLNTVAAIDLAEPDDDLLQAVLLKLFADRQIAPEVAADVSAWLLPRMDRSLEAASRIVAALDQRSLAERRRIDSRLAAEILNEPSSA